MKNHFTAQRLRYAARVFLKWNALLLCLTLFLWLAKCPAHEVEWWRAICMGLLLPVMKPLL